MGAIFLVSLLVTSALVTAFLVKIPADHFVSLESPLSRRFRSGAARVGYRVTKNLIGVVLVVVGFILALPGVPGQGLLTMLVGVFLLDFPGKKKIELKAVSKPRILRNINRLRARFNKPPLMTTPASKEAPVAEPPP